MGKWAKTGFGALFSLSLRTLGMRGKWGGWKEEIIMLSGERVGIMEILQKCPETGCPEVVQFAHDGVVGVWYAHEGVGSRLVVSGKTLIVSGLEQAQFVFNNVAQKMGQKGM